MMKHSRFGSIPNEDSLVPLLKQPRLMKFEKATEVMKKWREKKGGFDNN